MQRLKKRDQEREEELGRLAKAKDEVEKAATEAAKARKNFEMLEEGYNKQRADDQAEIKRLKEEVARLASSEEAARNELAQVDIAVRGKLRGECLYFVLARLFSS